MNDEADDTTPSEFSINASDFKSMIAADLRSAKEENERAVEETKEHISDFINKNILSLCFGGNEDFEDPEMQFEDEQEDLNEVELKKEDSEVLDIEKVIRKSFTALSEKAKVDIQVVHLMDQADIKETRQEVKQFYQKHTKNIAKNVKQDFVRKHAETTEQVEEKKKDFEVKVKNFTKQLPFENRNDSDAACFVDFLQGLADKTATDFNKSNESTQETVKQFTSHLQSLFPPPRKTTEELESENFIKENMIAFKNKVVADMQEQKLATEQSIRDTKTRVSNYPDEMLNGVKNFSKLSLKKVREKTFGSEDENIAENIEEDKDELAKETSFVVEMEENIEENIEEDKDKSAKETSFVVEIEENEKVPEKTNGSKYENFEQNSEGDKNELDKVTDEKEKLREEEADETEKMQEEANGSEEDIPEEHLEEAKKEVPKHISFVEEMLEIPKFQEKTNGSENPEEIIEEDEDKELAEDTSSEKEMGETDDEKDPE